MAVAVSMLLFFCGGVAERKRFDSLDLVLW